MDTARTVGHLQNIFSTSNSVPSPFNVGNIRSSTIGKSNTILISKAFEYLEKKHIIKYICCHTNEFL